MALIENTVLGQCDQVMAFTENSVPGQCDQVMGTSQRIVSLVSVIR